MAVRYCDRRACRSAVLFFDILTLQELCQECCDRLTRRRGIVARPAHPEREGLLGAIPEWYASRADFRAPHEVCTDLVSRDSMTTLTSG